MAFRTGQKVVCVNNTPRSPRSWTGPYPEIGAIYIIDGFRTHYGEECLIIGSLDPDWQYAAMRFRPLIERKTDTGMAILRKLLDGNKIEEKV